MGGQLWGRTFRSDRLERSFRRRGFVVVPFLEGDEHHSLAALVDAVVPYEAPFYSTALQPWSPELRHFDRLVTTQFRARVESLFCDHDLRGAYALYKGPSVGPDGGEVPYHQDHSFVDETKHAGVVVWSPIGHVSAESGSLSVVPGSHARFRGPRGSGQIESGWEPIDRFIGRAAVRVHVPLGSALIYDGALIHGSPKNSGASPRRVIGLGVVPRSAQVVRYHGIEPGVVERLDVIDDYFRQADCPPTARPADHIVSTSIFEEQSRSSGPRWLKLKLDRLVLGQQSIAVGRLRSMRRLLGAEQAPWPR